MEIEAMKAVDASDDDLTAVHALEVAHHRELMPDDPESPLERFVLRTRSAEPYGETFWWIAREGGEVAGYTSLRVNRNVEENRHQAWFDGVVAPERRKQGVATALLAPALEAAEADGRTVMGFMAEKHHPSVDFCRRVAGDARYVERQSRLWLDRLDHSMLHEWVDRAVDRAQGYELGGFDGRCPDEHLEEFAEAVMVMNTAPREDLDDQDEVVTPEMVRAEGDHWASLGLTPWVIWARHVETGEIAGWTSVFHDRFTPWRLGQGGTGVWQHHRERGLGRWLKAAMLLRVLEECPDVRWIDTDNAGSNKTMLAINDQLGFEPTLWWSVHQAPADQVRQALGI